MPLPDEEYQAFLAALGNLCIHWAWLDRELNFLIGEMLALDRPKGAALLTEMMDVAPRCRTVKRLSLTVGAPKEWRSQLIDLMNMIENRLGPLRNRFIHDHWSESDAVMVKLDRRAKVVKPQSFREEELAYDTKAEISKDLIDDLAVAVIIALTDVATARLDLEGRIEGRFPEQPGLGIERLRQFYQARLQSD